MNKDIFVLSALGENPQEFCDYDLVNEMIGKGDYIGSNNYEVWILSAASKGNYTISDDNKEKLETIYEDILACQGEEYWYPFCIFSLTFSKAFSFWASVIFPVLTIAGICHSLKLSWEA